MSAVEIFYVGQKIKMSDIPSDYVFWVIDKGLKIDLVFVCFLCAFCVLSLLLEGVRRRSFSDV